jgi:hypothetical protein
MLMVFEVHHVANLDPNDILSEEVRNETMAQIMTPSEARAVGFQGARDAEPGRGSRTSRARSATRSSSRTASRRTKPSPASPRTTSAARAER